MIYPDMCCYEYEKYVISKEKMRETLEKYGVAIIPNVCYQEYGIILNILVKNGKLLDGCRGQPCVELEFRE